MFSLLIQHCVWVILLAYFCMKISFWLSLYYNNLYKIKRHNIKNAKRFITLGQVLFGRTSNMSHLKNPLNHVMILNKKQKKKRVKKSHNSEHFVETHCTHCGHKGILIFVP